MRKSRAMIGSSIFLVLAPGVVGGLIPYWLTGWQMLPIWGPVRMVGALLTAAGAALLLHSFWQFVNEGSGTPAPIAPTERLVVGGVYRFVRNPMYVAVLATIFGQALLLGQMVLFFYGGAVWVMFMCFVHFYEAPVLRRRYGAQYEEYERSVPGWIPRLAPWKGPA